MDQEDNSKEDSRGGQNGERDSPEIVGVLVVYIVHEVQAVEEIVGAPEIGARGADLAVDGADVERGVAVAFKVSRPGLAAETGFLRRLVQLLHRGELVVRRPDACC